MLCPHFSARKKLVVVVQEGGTPIFVVVQEGGTPIFRISLEPPVKIIVGCLFLCPGGSAPRQPTWMITTMCEMIYIELRLGNCWVLVWLYGVEYLLRGGIHAGASFVSK